MIAFIEKQKFPINCKDCFFNGGNIGFLKFTLGFGKEEDTQF